MRPRPRLLAPGLATAALFVPWSAAAVGLALPDQVATEGAPVRIRVELIDDPGVVGRVEVAVRRPDGRWLARDAVVDRGVWIARFEASEVDRAAGDAVPVRAVAFGARGGRLVDLGFDEPLMIPMLSPRRARQRALDLARAAQSARAGGEDEDVAGLVAVAGAMNDPARLRAEVGAVIRLSPRWATVARVGVGPGFSPPDDVAVGAIALGAHLGLRRQRMADSPGAWAPFAGLGLDLDARFPGLDLGASAEAGFRRPLGTTTILELSLYGGALVRAVDTRSPFTAPRGGVRLGLAFGAPASRPR